MENNDKNLSIYVDSALDSPTPCVSFDQLCIDPTELVKQYRHRLVIMLTSLTKDTHRAEDLAHDALMIVIKKLEVGDVKERDKLAAYIFSTARFLYLGWLRRRDNQVELRETMEDLETSFSVQEDYVTAVENAQAIKQSLLDLTKPRDREILLRSFFMDQTKQEICDALRLSSEHYDRVMHRAKKRLKKATIRRYPQMA